MQTPARNFDLRHIDTRSALTTKSATQCAGSVSARRCIWFRPLSSAAGTFPPMWRVASRGGCDGKD